MGISENVLNIINCYTHGNTTRRYQQRITTETKGVQHFSKKSTSSGLLKS